MNSDDVARERLEWWVVPGMTATMAIAAFLAFAPALPNRFVNWDDPYYVTYNPGIRHLDWSSVKGIFLETHFTDYYPINLLTYAVDFRFWGANPLGYHLTNLFLHTANAALVFVLFRRLLGGLYAPALTALLFAVHPVQVESVAWVSERKSLLSTLFFLCSFLSFLGSRRKAVPARSLLFGLSLLLFALGVFSKGSVVILPLLLLVYLVAIGRASFRRSVLLVIPFLAIGLAGAFSVFWVQRSVNIVREAHGGGVGLITAIQMIAAFARYLAMLALPMHFSAYEPHPVGPSAFSAWLLPGALAVILLLALLWRAWRRDRAIFLCLAWFPIGLIPVSHVIPFPNLMAGRYLYVPAIGLFAAAALLLSRQVRLWSGRPIRRGLLIALGFACVILLSPTTHRWIGYWRDSHALWTQTLLTTPDSSPAQANLGAEYHERGQLWKAERHLRAAVALEPKDAGSWARLGGIALQTGDAHAALDLLHQAVAANDENWLAHFNLGLTQAALGDRAAAAGEMVKALHLDSTHPLPYYYLGLWSAEAGDAVAAIRWLRVFQRLGWPGPETESAQRLLSQLERTNGQ